MPARAGRDAERVLRFVADAEELGGDDPFAPRVLEALAGLVAADWGGYAECDFVRKRSLLAREYPSLDELWAGVDGDMWMKNPLKRRHLAGQFGAMRQSALLPQGTLTRTPYYLAVLEPLGVTDSMTVAIPSSMSHSKMFGFDRLGGEFRERDRLVLEVLQPHLARLWHSARTRRRLRTALAALEQASEQDASGLVFLAASGRIEFASPAALGLLGEYFERSSEAELPHAVRAWLDARAVATLSRRIGDRLLTVNRSGDALLLEETRDELRLTPRERQILSCVARGMTNGQIAETLWIAPSTVRKHLENVYAKLGVRTRTAAVTRFLGVLNDEP